MAIFLAGLQPGSPSMVASSEIPWICLSPTPSAAWSLLDWVFNETEHWDLWQVRLVEGDEVHIRPDFGPHIVEVKVRNVIPADRVWWVASRPG